jgi:hypothetical protein
MLRNSKSFPHLGINLHRVFLRKYLYSITKILKKLDLFSFIQYEIGIILTKKII